MYALALSKGQGLSLRAIEPVTSVWSIPGENTTKLAGVVIRGWSERGCPKASRCNCACRKTV